VTLGGLPSNAAASTTYLTARAAVADVTDDIAATGAIASSTTWALVFGAPAGSTPSGQNGSPATWQVTAVKAKVGDRVKKGDVLATATNANLKAAIATASNNVTTAAIQLATATDAHDAATTTDALRQTRIGLLNARNGLADARSALADLKAQLTHGSLVAPADGIVTVVNAKAGVNAPIADSIDLASTTFQVTANVVESDVATIQIGQGASVSVSAIDADLTGKVTAIAPVAETSTSGSSGVVSYAVTVALDAPPASLKPGMTADVTITTASASGVLAVPAAAIRGTSDAYTVLVMGANGTPVAQPVTVGLMTSSLVEIKSGLNAGDVVVTGTSSQQRAGTTNAGGSGTFVVPGGGGGGFRGGPGN
jgi:macrolide-specific efflux system membrane fusion protein